MDRYPRLVKLTDKHEVPLIMADVTRFKQYLQLADQLAQVASKEELAECARLLALNLAH